MLLPGRVSLGRLVPVALLSMLIVARFAPAQTHTCAYFGEDFGGTPAGWTAAGGHWYFQSEKLNVDQITSNPAYAVHAFSPSDFFALDTDVTLASFSSSSSVGIYPFTNGDVFLGAGTATVDGLGALYFGDGTAKLFGWDVVAGKWYLSPSIAVSGPVTSIGVAYAADAITLRINGANTALKVTGNFNLAPMVLDTLWVVAQGTGTVVRFDNICAGPFSTPPAKFRLSVNKAGTGSGTVTSAPAGINCGGDCSEDYNSGTNVALTAAPTAGSEFVAWSGACTSAPCSVLMTTARNVTATFNLLPAVDNPPTVSISSPATGATISGTVTVTAAATDDKKVNKVEFFVDGTKKGEKTAAPYTYAWNTTTAVNGRHSIRARATDSGGKTAEAHVTVTVANGGTAAWGSEARLYFPFCQAGGQNFTGFAVSNFSQQAAQLRFTAFAPSGEVLYAPGIFNLEAGRQFAKLSNELFGLGAGASQSAWIEMATDNPDVGSFYQFGAADQLDGSVPFLQAEGKLYFTRVFDGSTGYRGQSAETWLSIANPSAAPVTLELRLLAAGNPAPKTRTLPPYGFLYERVSSIFGTGTVTSGTVVATVTSGSGIVGFELVKLPTKKTVIGLSGQPVLAETTLYSAQLASLTGFFTSVKLVNTSGQAITATLRATDEAGNPLASAVQRNIAAGGTLESDAHTLFGWSATEVKVGSLVVESSAAGLLGDVVFGDSAKFTTAAALPLQTQKITRGIFSQVANLAGLFTGVALYNPGTLPAEVTIRVYSEQGSKTGEKNLTLQSGERTSKLLTDWMTSTAGQVRGYVEVRSTQPLIAQQLFGSATLLSAVPPTLSPTIIGPGGVAVELPPADPLSKGGLGLGTDAASSIVEGSEKAVSSVVKVTLAGPKVHQGIDPIRIDFAVTATSVDPAKLYAKVRLSTGHKLPVLGSYNAAQKVYSIHIFGLVHGWSMGLVQGTQPRRLLPQDAGGIQPAVSQTPMQWKTFDWEIVNETKAGTLTDEKIERDLRPLLRDIGIAYQSAGFRSPRLWYDPQTNLPRFYFIEKGGGDSGFYAPCPNNLCDSSDPVFAVSTQAGKEGMLLGSIYVDYAAYLTGVAAQGMNLDYLMAHEMFHSIQAGYDVKQSVEKGVGNRDWSTVTCYEEGTADLMGMTYQVRGNTLGPGPALVGPDSPDDLWGRRAWLDQPLDDYRVAWPYTRRDFFAFLAKIYFTNEGLSYQHDFWNALASAADPGPADSAPSSYLALYRKGLDNFLRAKGYSLPRAYFEFAFERAFNHTSDYLLYPAEQNDPSLAAKSLAVPLFSGNTGIKPWENPMGTPLVFSDLKPLVTVATTIDVPPSYKDKTFPILFKVENGEAKRLLDEEGIAVVIFRESWGQLVSQNPSIVVNDFSKPVEVLIDQNISHLTVLIMNCYVQQKVAKVTLQVAEEADKLWLRIGADAQDPSLPAWWSLFAPWDNVFSLRDYLPEVDAKGMDMWVNPDDGSFPFERSWSKSTAENATADYRVSGTGQILANAMPPGYIPTPGASLQGTWSVELTWVSSNGLSTENYVISGSFSYQGVYDITGIAVPFDGYDPLFTQNQSEGSYTATGKRVDKNDKGEVTFQEEKTITGKTHQFLVYLKRTQTN